MAQHAAPVILHIIHCLFFFATLKKCFHKMMVHIRRNHSFFRIQCNDFIKDFCSLFCGYCTGKYHPHLACVTELFFFSAYKQATLRIQKIFPCRFCLFFCFFCKISSLFCITKCFRNLLCFSCTVDVYALHGTLFIKSISPVNKSPETFAVFQQIFFIKPLFCDFHLTICAGT